MFNFVVITVPADALAPLVMTELEMAYTGQALDAVLRIQYCELWIRINSVEFFSRLHGNVLIWLSETDIWSVIVHIRMWPVSHFQSSILKYYDVIFMSQRNFENVMFNFVVITVPADALAPLGVRASAGTVMTELEMAYTGQTLDAVLRILWIVNEN